MDFPIFHLDFLGNRMLIAMIAILHVFISHALAVGAIPVIVAMEWWGRRRGDLEWDHLARRILFVCFVITTSIGALTGVGIWFSTSLVNPDAIGSLIRVFFWFWFFEWVVFCAEVILILIYYLTWRPMSGPRSKDLHVLLGVVLATFSWLTMAIITGILGFMMEPGNWLTQETTLAGFFNPMYLPQLAFRTSMAMIGAGVFAMFLTYFFARDAPALRGHAVRWVSVWALAWLPVAVVAGVWYWSDVPGWMEDNLPVALTTQDFQQWHEEALGVLAVASILILIVTLWGVLRPRVLPRVMLLVPFVAVLVLFGTFERVREFIRKPWVIAEYMYANGVREAEYPLLEEEGVLTRSTYVAVHEVTDDNRLVAGREVFRVACTRCHTVAGVNGVTERLRAMYGDEPWNATAVEAYLNGIHQARQFMPPVPGSRAERAALAEYLVSLQRYPDRLEGAQSGGFGLDRGVAAPPASAGRSR